VNLPIKSGKSAAASAVYSVLLIDDNDTAEILSPYRDVFKQQTLSFEHCACLADGLSRLAQDGSIDLILLNLSLPDSQGIDTLKKIRLAAPKIPIVMLSETVEDDIALYLLKDSDQDYLIKDRADAKSLCHFIDFALSRTRVQETNVRLAAIVDASNDAIIGKTLNGTITSWNKGAEQLFGYSADEATGKSIAMIIPTDSPNEFQDILSLMRNGESIRGLETVRINKNGDRIDVLSSFSPIVREDGTITGAAGFEYDNTKRKGEERILRESSERDRLFVAGVKDYAIFMLDTKGIVKSWNEGAARLKGYDAAEIIGKHFSVFYSDMDQQLGKPDSELKTAMAKGTFQDESWRVRKDGSRFFANVLITALVDASGKLCGFTKVTRNVTDRKLAEQEMAEMRLRLSLALQAAEVGVWDLDLVKGTFWRSLRHDQIFGHDSSLPEWSFAIFLTHVLPEDQAQAREVFEQGLKSGRFKLECRIMRSDESVRWILAQGETFRDETRKPIRMIGTIVDITDRKKREDHQRLTAVIKEREDFMATLTHDMKNPLIGANRLLELLVTGRLGQLTSQQNDLLETMMQSNSSVLNLIGTLTEVYRLETDANSLVLANIDMIKLVASAASRMATFTKLREINFSTQLPTQMDMMQGDSISLQRVLQNLLDNAVKFTPQAGTITLRMFSRDDQVIIEIEDNGPGIKPEDQVRLFNRFSQGDVGKRCAGGSGLGLYLCKQIIEAHNGKIECESQVNVATIFRVKLPYSQQKKA
jgi:PAS domain S-box-containing protein